MKRPILAALILGVILGSVGSMLYVTKDLDKLHDHVSQLETELQQMTNDNTLLKAQVQTPDAQRLIRGLRVECTTPTDLAVQSDLKSRVVKGLSFLQGKPQDILLKYPDLPSQILDGQLVYIDTRKFRLHVTVVIIVQDELTVYIRGQLES